MHCYNIKTLKGSIGVAIWITLFGKKNVHYRVVADIVIVFWKALINLVMIKRRMRVHVMKAKGLMLLFTAIMIIAVNVRLNYSCVQNTR